MAYNQVKVLIYNFNNNDNILIGNIYNIFLYSFKTNNVTTIIHDKLYDIKGFCKGKNDSIYLLDSHNICLIDLKDKKFYPLLNDDSNDFDQSYFSSSIISREDSFMVNHQNKVLFFKKSKEKKEKLVSTENNTSLIDKFQTAIELADSNGITLLILLPLLVLFIYYVYHKMK